MNLTISFFPAFSTKRLKFAAQAVQIVCAHIKVGCNTRIFYINIIFF